MNTPSNLPVLVSAFVGSLVGMIVCGLLEKGFQKLTKWLKKAYLKARHLSG